MTRRVRGVGLQFNPTIVREIGSAAFRDMPIDFAELLCDMFAAPLDCGYVLDPAMRPELDRVIRFATLARDNLDVAAPLIDRLAQPIEVEKQSVSAPTPPLDVFAVAVAATLTLTFVTLLLVAGSLALEREENTFPRLTGGLVSRSALLGEKVGLGIAVGLIVTLLMLAGVELFVGLDWSRFGLWLVAILAAAAGLSLAGFPAALAWATLPTAALSIVVCLGRFSPRRLRELGWAIVGSSTLTLVILVAGLR